MQTVGNKRRSREHGATALIVVVFCILILTTISVGFMRLVIQDQNRSVDGELARGANDSALAGVEDGKRVLELCDQGVASACAAISASECTTVADAGLVALSTDAQFGREVKLKTTSTSTESYDQSYTCVKVARDTPDYRATIAADESRIIPLDTTGELQNLSIFWFRRVVGGNVPTTTTLPVQGLWPSNRPPILRVQLMTYQKNGYVLTDFDRSGAVGTAGANTLYLYPRTTGSTSLNFTLDGRAHGANALRNVLCGAAVDDVYDTYLCKVNLVLPQEISAKSATSGYGAYMRVTALYGPADFAARLTDTTFDNVQPEIDSTGRAADIFRRVSARVEKTNPLDALLFPRATVDITSNFCKSFGVTDDTTVALLPNCRYDQP